MNRLNLGQWTLAQARRAGRAIVAACRPAPPLATFAEVMELSLEGYQALKALHQETADGTCNQGCCFPDGQIQPFPCATRLTVEDYQRRLEALRMPDELPDHWS